MHVRRSAKRSASDLQDAGAPRRGAPARARRLTAEHLLLAAVDVAGLYLIYSLARKGGLALPGGLLVMVVLANWVALSRRLYPVRWLVPGLALMLLMVVYPLLHTVYTAFTNRSDGHLLSKQQVIEQLESQYYVPPEGVRYAWRAYRSPDGRYLLWLTDPQGKQFIGTPSEGVGPVQPADPRFGAADDDGLPRSIGEYGKLSRIESVKYLSELQGVDLSQDGYPIRIASLDAAQQAESRYSYDAQRDALVDKQTGIAYQAREGFFAAPDGTTLSPGFAAVVGAQNFRRMFTDKQIRGPFLRVFVWTFVFAGLSALLTFGVGLGLALVLNDHGLPLKGFFRSLIILPYTIPGFISALVWVGLLNPYYGPVNLAIQRLTGISPQWFSDPTLAKAATLIVNTWLGYPYMLLVSLGALQSIPSDLYEVAQIDGANRWQQFRSVTLPLLLLSIAPLLIGCFAFNFNNFTVIDLVTEGGPPMVGGLTPAGHTDILISYTYRLAFAGGRGADYGFASAISFLIFVIVAAITMFNFRYTGALEEVSENV